MSEPDELAALRDELLAMRAADQGLREQAMSIMREKGPQAPELQAIRERGRAEQAQHTTRLEEILDKHGWPSARTVGEDASVAAWLLLQHSPIEVQKARLPLLRAATEQGDVPARCLPYVEDRVRMSEGRDQLCGTQITRGEDGKPTLWPIEDPNGVDARREAAGLEPLNEYLQRFGLQRPDLE